MAPALLILALEFHRAPLRFAHLSDPARPLPEHFGDWLAESVAALAPGRIDAAAEALSAPPEELQEAFLFFLRQTLLMPQADHYRVLGLSPSCSAEAIKQHHSLLVRLFHPDRYRDAFERGIALTARINLAYGALRDPEARRRYDQRRPRRQQAASTYGDADEFFRPGDPVAKVARGRWGGIDARRTGSRALMWVLAAAVAVALVIVLFAGQEPRHPVLRVNPELAGGSSPFPSYLRGEASNTAGARSVLPIEPVAMKQASPAASPSAVTAEGPLFAQPGGNEVRARPPPATQGSTESGPPVPSVIVRPDAEPRGPDGTARPPKLVDRAPPRLEQPAHPEQTPRSPEKPAPMARTEPRETPATARMPHAPEMIRADRLQLPEKTSPENAPASHATPDGVRRLIRRLERSLANGDTSGLAGLYTTNAVVNSGVGLKAVREMYADLGESGAERRVTLDNLRWSGDPHRRLTGSGSLRISIRPGPSAKWQGKSAPVDLELVPWMGDYRISKLIHRLPAR